MSSRGVVSVAFKAVLIGDGAVGKTSIRQRYLGEGFKISHIATIGVDFAQKWVSYSGQSIRFVIWDLSGQRAFERVRQHYYQGSHGILLVYSVIDRESFHNASKWLVEVFKYMGKIPPTVVIANKIDLRVSSPEGSFLTKEDGEQLTRLFVGKLGVPASYVETSALTGENIDLAFKELLRMMSEVEREKGEDSS
ncbi:MAG: Rab family GTPase [Candidatus Thorarchaeota archaeon]|jgi:small GTP-binding protein